MLYNHHLGIFKVKNSFESRLFKPGSLQNLDEVQNEFKEALECCVKLPEVSYVVFYIGEPEKEVEFFKKLRSNLIEMIKMISTKNKNSL
jgi:hypothetical protein